MKKPEIPPNITVEDFEEIFKVFKDTEFFGKLHEIEKDYPYWEEFKYKTRGMKYDPVTLWKCTKMTRASTSKTLKISATEGFVFKYNSNSKIQELLHQFDLNLGGKLEGGAIVPNEDKERILISSIMEEAIASSQLEGAVTSREMAKEMLRSERKPKDKSEKMILNNYLTIKRVIEIKHKSLSPELVKEIHAIVTKDTLKNSANEGRFRENNEVKIVDDTGEVFYNPPDCEKLEQLIFDFCEFANNKHTGEFIHPIIKAIILHFLIGYIHPFVDGNGRTARAIFYWYLISKGYWLVEYLSISRIIVKSPTKYARSYLYTEYDENDLTYFISYNLRAMNLALKGLKEYINRKIAERRNLYDIVKNVDINERQAEIIKELITDGQKMYTINMIKTQFAVVYQTARTDLLKLVSMGYLKEKYSGNKILFFKSDDFESKIKSVLK